MIPPRNTTNSLHPGKEPGTSRDICRPLYRRFFVAVAGFSAILISASADSLGQVPPAPSPTFENEPRDAEVFSALPTNSPQDFLPDHFLGSQSCSASSCHGSPRRESVLGSAAHFFFDNDRHQRGGAVLREKRSDEIVKRLHLPKPAWETKECLVCHAPAAVNFENRPGLMAKVTDGVGCESCHGAARNWLAHHHTLEWKIPEIWSTESKESLGFRETKNVLSRINACADCHVGNANQSVNHDLIAAGHPRLVFEYAAYQSLMPAHWRRSEDRQRQAAATGSPWNQPNSAAKDWLLGQLVNAEHELRITSTSAGNQNDVHSGYPNKVWPELAQYDCFACHHDLKSASWQQSRSDFDLDLKPGQLQWGTWSLGLLPELKTSLNNLVDHRLIEDLSTLQKKMRSPIVETKSVSDDILSLQHRLRLAATFLDKAELRSDDLRAIRNSLLTDSARVTNQGWDQSTQLYLALVAIDIGLSENPYRSDRMKSAREVTYRQLREHLSFSGSTKLSPPFEHRESPFRLQQNRQKIQQGFDDLTIQQSSELQQ